MESKIKVIICTGTACYVMGGAQLLSLKDHLPKELKDKVTIEGSTCLGYCKEDTEQKPPFVVIGKTVISEASLSTVIMTIKDFFEKHNKTSDH